MSSLAKRENLINIADRLFLGSIISQVILMLALTGVISTVVYRYQLDQSSGAVKRIFSEWERRITESVYVEEIVGNASITENSTVNEFSKSLLQSGFPSQVRVGSCASPMWSYDQIFLSVGADPLKTCLYIATNKPNLFENMKWLLLSAILSLSIVILTWIFVRRRMNTLVLAPLVSEIKRKSKAESLGEIVAQVAHDLRSPIAVLQSLESEDSLKVDRKPLINGALRQISSIVDDLIMKYKEQSKGAAVPALKPADLHELVLQTVADKKIEHQAEINVTVIGDPAIYMGKVNPTGFTRIFSNILNNAVEASAGMSECIEVTLRTEYSNMRIDVRDIGPGISSDLLPRLGKEPLDPTHSDGLGIGLFHAFQTVREWDGRIRIQSEVGRGTTVSILIPLCETSTSEVSNVGVQSTAPELALIENDDYIRKLWSLDAKAANMQIVTFKSASDFIEANIAKWVPVYIDQNLGHEDTGLVVAANLNQIGYQNLHLATADLDLKDFELPNYIKSIQGKRFPAPRTQSGDLT